MIRKHILRHALAFVFGFGVVFVLLGISAGVIGRFVPAVLPTIRFAGGIILVFFGLIVLGFLDWLAERLQAIVQQRGRGWLQLLLSLLDRGRYLFYSDRRQQLPSQTSYPTSVVTGVVFAAGWSPCLGPILSAILLLAAEQQSVAQATSLMIVYTLGLAVPFLVAGVAIDRIAPRLRQLNRHVRLISLFSGLFLIFTGWLLLSGHLLTLSAEIIYRFGLGFRLEETLLGGTAVSFPLAFLAGILSFFSPCVLPLIPAYLGYMGQTAVYPTQ